ncbi:four helix bundle protein [Bacteroidota bacterium]
MFDFQKLKVYQKVKDFNKSIKSFIGQNSFDKFTNDQLRRASFSILLNIAEGSSRFSNKDRRNFLIIARGSAFECVSILDYLLIVDEINQEEYQGYFMQLEEISKMLFALIKKFET